MPPPILIRTEDMQVVKNWAYNEGVNQGVSMAKITPVHIFDRGPYLYVIDDKGRIWRKAENGSWREHDALPDEPAETARVDLDLSQLNETNEP